MPYNINKVFKPKWFANKYLKSNFGISRRVDKDKNKCQSFYFYNLNMSCLEFYMVLFVLDY